MMQERVLFDKFKFPVLKGLHYLTDKNKEIANYLFVNEPHTRFSMFFESTERPSVNDDRCQFELTRPNRRIRFYYPDHVQNRESVMWCFSVEIFDKNGNTHVLPGQVRIAFAGGGPHPIGNNALFLELLEKVELNEETCIA